MDSPRRSKLIRLNSDDTSYEIVCIVSQNGTAEPLIYRNDDAERSDRFDILVDGETCTVRNKDDKDLLVNDTYVRPGADHELTNNSLITTSNKMRYQWFSKQEKSTIIISSNDEDDSIMEPGSVTVVPSNQETPTLPIGDEDDTVVLVVADLPRPNSRTSTSDSPVETETNRDDELSGLSHSNADDASDAMESQPEWEDGIDTSTPYKPASIARNPLDWEVPVEYGIAVDLNENYIAVALPSADAKLTSKKKSKTTESTEKMSKAIGEPDHSPSDKTFRAVNPVESELENVPIKKQIMKRARSIQKVDQMMTPPKKRARKTEAERLREVVNFKTFADVFNSDLSNRRRSTRRPPPPTSTSTRASKIKTRRMTIF